MFTSLRIVLLTCLLFLTSPLCAEEPPAAETPPTPEEIQAALDKISKWFTWGPSQPPAAPVKQPEWYPREAEDVKRVEEVLTAWSASRAKGGSLRCQFRQWEFDPAFGPQDRKTPYVYSEGEYRWDAADVWMWRGTSAQKAVANGDKTEWREVDPENRARNKSTIYEFDYRIKTLYERRIPEGSADIPPFGIFGIIVGSFTSSAELLRLDPAGLPDRFWIRPVTVTTGKNERWLELLPKKVADARQFSSLLVAVSESDWEVCSLDIRAPNYAEKTNPAHTSIAFLNRTRPTAASGLLKTVLGSSYSCIPTVPTGWKRVVEDYRGIPIKK
ncbi:MAG: hypothetical protein IAF94_08670 [Pirellulaceae bacterium]|nr:hypothetical protein [Pirellulaceae bacterium]